MTPAVPNAPSTGEGRRFECITGIDRLGDLEPAWQRLLATTPCNRSFSSHAWYRTALDLAPEAEPRVFCCWRGDRLTALLPLVRLPSGEACFPGDMSDYNDLLVAENQLAEGNALLAQVGTGENGIRRLELREIRHDSQILRILAASSGGRVALAQTTLCPYLTVPASHEAWLRNCSRKMRIELRRSWRVAKAQGAVVRELQFGDEDPGYLAQSFLNLHLARFGRYSCFLTEPKRGFVLRLIPRLWQRRLLRPFCLFQGERLVGMQLCMVGVKGLCNWNGGFDPRDAQLTPGRLLMAAAIKTTIEEHLQEYDFMRGDEAYKARWTNGVRRIGQLSVRVEGPA